MNVCREGGRGEREGIFLCMYVLEKMGGGRILNTECMGCVVWGVVVCECYII